MFAGCTSDHPEVTITYSFNGTEYEVDYILSRKTAPRTVQHFIELADAEYYNGMCIHDYTSTAMYTGGYTYEDNELVEKDYYTAVADLQLEKSVFYSNSEKTPLLSVYGEFEKNGVKLSSGSKYTHSAGALVMYYSDKGDDNTRVTTLRNDGGDANDGNAYQDNCSYTYNSATSLFYTYLGSSSSSLDAQYCVFGKAKDYDTQMTGDDGLITAIEAYTEDLDEDFTTETSVILNKYDPIANVKNSKIQATFHVPVVPITIVSVKVTKY
jgi:cyclophilin family peptidyl-prolyl cis-trans isomerase